MRSSAGSFSDLNLASVLSLDADDIVGLESWKGPGFWQESFDPESSAIGPDHLDAGDLDSDHARLFESKAHGSAMEQRACQAEHVRPANNFVS